MSVACRVCGKVVSGPGMLAVHMAVAHNDLSETPQHGAGPGFGITGSAPAPPERGGGGQAPSKEGQGLVAHGPLFSPSPPPLTPFRDCPADLQARCFLSHPDNLDRLAYDARERVWRFVA